MVPGYSSRTYSIGTDAAYPSVMFIRTSNGIMTGDGEFVTIPIAEIQASIDARSSIQDPPPPKAIEEELEPRKKSWKQKQKELPKFLRDKARYL